MDIIKPDYDPEGWEWVAISPIIKADGETFFLPGEPMGDYVLDDLFQMYMEDKVGPAGHPWTECMIEGMAPYYGRYDPDKGNEPDEPDESDKDSDDSSDDGAPQGQETKPEVPKSTPKAAPKSKKTARKPRGKK